MLKIRLQRVGRKNDPSFRLVVTEHTNKPQTGNVLEVLGSYDARKGDPVLKSDRINHWLSKGAQTSETVHNLLIRGGITEGKTVNPLPKKSPIKKEQEEAPAAAPTSEEVGAPTASVGGEPEEKTEEKPEAPASEGVEASTASVGEESPEEKKKEE